LRENQGIWLNGQPTINHTLAAALLYRDKKYHTKKEVDDFAEFLDRGRIKAINILWESGEEYYIVGESRIEIISSDKKYKMEHLRRAGHKLDTRKIGTSKRTIGIEDKEARPLGLPTSREIKQSVKRLQSSITDLHEHIKSLGK